MKITSLEIRQQTFERVFRGYEKEAVDAFLASLSQEWERGQDELRSVRQRNETLEAEIGKLKAIENTLYRTLQTAEETSTQMAHKARTDADQRLLSANTEAEETLLNARKQANMLVLDAENKARYVVDEALEELRSLERDYKAIERYKEYLVTEIKRYATDTLDKVSRFEDKARKGAFEAKFGELKTINLSSTHQPEPEEAQPEEPAAHTTTWEMASPEAAPEPAPDAPQPDEAAEPEEESLKKKEDESPSEAASGSFFDTV